MNNVQKSNIKGIWLLLNSHYMPHPHYYSEDVEVWHNVIENLKTQTLGGVLHAMGYDKDEYQIKTFNHQIRWLKENERIRAVYPTIFRNYREGNGSIEVMPQILKKDNSNHVVGTNDMMGIYVIFDEYTQGMTNKEVLREVKEEVQEYSEWMYKEKGVENFKYYCECTNNEKDYLLRTLYDDMEQEQEKEQEKEAFKSVHFAEPNELENETVSFLVQKREWKQEDIYTILGDYNDFLSFVEAYDENDEHTALFESKAGDTVTLDCTLINEYILERELFAVWYNYLYPLPDTEHITPEQHMQIVKECPNIVIVRDDTGMLYIAFSACGTDLSDELEVVYGLLGYERGTR